MKKLDWYILKNFLSTFFFAIFLFTIIAVVIDLSEKTDNFVKSHLGFFRIVTGYYYGFIPHIVALLFPLFVYISVIFFTSKMANRTEIIPILASGISYNRWLRPYYMGGFILAGLLWLADQYVIPKANQIRSAFEARYVDNDNSYNQLTMNTNTSIYFKIDSFTYAGILNYDTLTKRGGPFFMERVEKSKVTQNIRGENIQWDTATKKWRLENTLTRTILPLGEKLVLVPTQQANFNFKPLDLSRDKYTKDKLTSPELAKFINLEESRGSEGINDLKVELYRRDATPVTVFLLTVIGAIVAGRKVRGGSGAHLAVGFITAAAFIITDRFSTIFSTKGNLPPIIAAWIPNGIFVFVAMYLYKKAPK
ncbi:LptF/LptG family permease [Parasediminibacterium sp. JCM 36343]|uniref:LptF/LptG family permease n=1 Tax=Parasediminibacterium sp. JCM 36343 TaxID=3374279 RepID=UPI00397B5EF7